MPAPPNLQRHLAGLRTAVKELPQVAARELDDLADQAHALQLAPDGSRWEPTKKDGQPFDAQHHIQYHPVVRGEQVMLESDHPAAGYSRWGTRKMKARPQVPGRNDSLGWWLGRLIKVFRKRLGRVG